MEAGNVAGAGPKGEVTVGKGTAVPGTQLSENLSVGLPKAFYYDHQNLYPHLKYSGEFAQSGIKSSSWVVLQDVGEEG